MTTVRTLILDERGDGNGKVGYRAAHRYKARGVFSSTFLLHRSSSARLAASATLVVIPPIILPLGHSFTDDEGEREETNNTERKARVPYDVTYSK